MHLTYFFIQCVCGVCVCRVAHPPLKHVFMCFFRVYLWYWHCVCIYAYYNTTNYGRSKQSQTHNACSAAIRSPNLFPNKNEHCVVLTSNGFGGEISTLLALKLHTIRCARCVYLNIISICIVNRNGMFMLVHVSCLEKLFVVLHVICLLEVICL